MRHLGARPNLPKSFPWQARSQVWILGGGSLQFFKFYKKKKIDIGLTLFAFILQNLCRHALMMLRTNKVLLRFPFCVGRGNALRFIRPVIQIPLQDRESRIGLSTVLITRWKLRLIGNFLHNIFHCNMLQPYQLPMCYDIINNVDKTIRLGTSYSNQEYEQFINTDCQVFVSTTFSGYQIKEKKNRPQNVKYDYCYFSQIAPKKCYHRLHLYRKIHQVFL